MHKHKSFGGNSIPFYVFDVSLNKQWLYHENTEVEGVVVFFFLQSNAQKTNSYIQKETRSIE